MQNHPPDLMQQKNQIANSLNRIKLQIALFGAGASFEAACKASLLVTRLTPGYILSKAECEIIQRALRELT